LHHPHATTPLCQTHMSDVAVSEVSRAPRPSAALNRPFAILAKHGHLQERYVMQLTRTTSLCCVLVCRGGCSSSCSFRRMDFLGTCPCSGMTFKTASGYDPHTPFHPPTPRPCGHVHVLPCHPGHHLETTPTTPSIHPLHTHVVVSMFSDDIQNSIWVPHLPIYRTPLLISSCPCSARLFRTEHSNVGTYESC